MKVAFFVFLSVIILSGCTQGKVSHTLKESEIPDSKPRDLALMSFDDGTVYDFGNVKGEMKLTHGFVYRNASDSVSLVIDSVRLGCGCTTASYPHHPVRPGESDTIFVTYDTAKGYNGFFLKSCVVYSNSPYTLELKVTGTADLESE